MRCATKEVFAKEREGDDKIEMDILTKSWKCPLLNSSIQSAFYQYLSPVANAALLNAFHKHMGISKQRQKRSLYARDSFAMS